MTRAPVAGHRIDLETRPRSHRLRCACGWTWTSRAKAPDLTAAINRHRDDVAADAATQADAAAALKGTA